MEKVTSNLKSENGKYTVDYFNDTDYTRWIPIKRAASILEIEQTYLLDKLDKHYIKEILENDEDGYPACYVDSLALLKLEEVVKDPVLFENILNFSVKKPKQLPVEQIQKAIEVMVTLINQNEELYNKVNYYDRLRGDLLHQFEHGEDKADEILKASLLRRKTKFLKLVSDALKVIKVDDLIEINKSLNSLIFAYKNKMYNNRLTSEERERWKNEYMECTK